MFECVSLFLTVIRLDLIGISGIFDRLNCIFDALSACRQVTGCEDGVYSVNL